MSFVSQYTSHQPDMNGFIQYSTAEHRVWQLLYHRQRAVLPGRACHAHIAGLDKLGLTEKEIPQLPDVSQRLRQATGWEVVPVAALIPARAFFELLAQRKFPAATFIRTEAELDYVTEPDIFHELFGHCPLLTDKVYADFLYEYARTVLTFPESDWPLLQRFFWFTVEFGLIQTPDGLRAYGGGILSSIGETAYCVESDVPMRAYFDPIAILRTPYRIDQLQPIYFVIPNYQALYQILNLNLKTLLARAHVLGEYPPLFDVDPNNPCIHIHAC